MSDIINNPVLVSAIQDLARGIKSEADLSSLRELLKITVEASLNAPKWKLNWAPQAFAYGA